MEQGETKPASAFNNPTFTSSLAVQLNLWEYDGVLLPDDGLGGTTLPCTPREERPIQIVRTADIEYIVWVRVTSRLP
ncbi:hypothetical protein GCM10009682_08570 [Luedemannella flava]|uniref:Uncharacterized protein n=2 Tax=Luedemannella flava TaxID=349316 RepID=A0ABN2LI42_9ACTN